MLVQRDLALGPVRLARRRQQGRKVLALSDNFPVEVPYKRTADDFDVPVDGVVSGSRDVSKQLYKRLGGKGRGCKSQPGRHSTQVDVPFEIPSHSLAVPLSLALRLFLEGEVCVSGLPQHRLRCRSRRWSRSSWSVRNTFWLGLPTAALPETVVVVVDVTVPSTGVGIVAVRLLSPIAAAATPSAPGGACNAPSTVFSWLRTPECRGLHFPCLYFIMEIGGVSKPARFLPFLTPSCVCFWFHFALTFASLFFVEEGGVDQAAHRGVCPRGHITHSDATRPVWLTVSPERKRCRKGTP